MSRPLVSAVVPTYNRAYCVPRAIDSVLAQSHGAVEVLVVDDGSTDNTADLIRERYGHEPRVRYFAQPNRGAATARNTGLINARGEFLALLDSDDYWHPWKLEAQLAAFRRFPEVGLIWTEFEAIDPAGRIVDPRHMKTMFSGYSHFADDELFPRRYPMNTLAPQLSDRLGEATFFVGNVFSQMLVGGLVPTSTSVYRRERFDKVGLFFPELLIGEDFNYQMRTAREGLVGYIDAPCMQYQRGLTDHLTRESNQLEAALAHLQTISGFIERDRDLVLLPEWQIHAVLADLHYCVGEKAVSRGERRLAREHFATSLRHNWRQRRCLGMLLATALPAPFDGSLRKAYRACKRLIRADAPAVLTAPALNRELRKRALESLGQSNP